VGLVVAVAEAVVELAVQLAVLLLVEVKLGELMEVAVCMVVALVVLADQLLEVVAVVA
jgi:hypothetical protein